MKWYIYESHDTNPLPFRPSHAVSKLCDLALKWAHVASC